MIELAMAAMIYLAVGCALVIQTLAIRTWEDESAPVDPYRAMLVVLIWPVMVLAAVAIGLYRLWKEAGKDD